MPRGPITVTWPEAGRLPLEAQFALALLPGCSLGTARRNRAEGPPVCMFPRGLPVIIRAPAATETVT